MTSSLTNGFESATAADFASLLLGPIRRATCFRADIGAPEKQANPIVMLTAYGQEELVARAVEAGVFG